MAILISAEIIDLRVMFRVSGGPQFQHVQNSANAILDIQIAFALRAIAENIEAIGMFKKLLIEVKNMAVGITFS